jgi:hypothetical protein
MLIQEWALAKLDAVKQFPSVLVRDPLQLLANCQGAVDRFARENGFVLISAATNLAFRDTYEKVAGDPKIKKVMVIDRASVLRRKAPAVHRAPPPFYPDLLARTSREGRIDLDLRQYLQERTNDPGWPQDTNDPRFARLIVRHLEGVIRAHENLRTADRERFSDTDFRAIVGFATLGVPEAAFKKLETLDYWKVALLRHESLKELEELAPQVTQPILEKLRHAPAPFCWFTDHDPELVLRAFYLSVILAQHGENWNLLLANLDATLKPLSTISPELLDQAAPQLISLDQQQADRDLTEVESSLTKENLGFLFTQQYKMQEPAGFLAVLERERYSSLFRSVALLCALDQVLGNQPDAAVHDRIKEILSEEDSGQRTHFAARRNCASWLNLREAYRSAVKIQELRIELKKALQFLKVTPLDKLSFRLFRVMWNGRRLNRLEYYLSSLERLVDQSELLSRPTSSLPSFCENALVRIRHQVRAASEEVHRHLNDLNARFQDLVAREYPSWVAGTADVVLTSQFLQRCLKPYWDPQKGKAALFIFDGMRYDIWHELLRPTLLERMEEIKDLPGCSILPSETQITRKAISAGTYPDEFSTEDGEDRLLKTALARDFSLNLEVKTLPPDGSGTGETVRYRAGNLDVYIFELCDKELHKIPVKKLPDGREVPGRPLAFIYQQHIRNIIDTEVMSIMRKLAPGTTVFITADHGFGRMGREPIWFDDRDLNEPFDCSYLNCWLKTPWDQASVPQKVRSGTIAFSPAQLRMPKSETIKRKSGEVVQKEYRTIVFPRPGYTFSRQGSQYKPDAYSHGGISIQEMFIPMVVLRVKAQDEGIIALEKLELPAEVLEGEEIECRIRLRCGAADVRVDLDASYAHDPEPVALSGQVHYLKQGDQSLSYRFKPEIGTATDQERKAGLMSRVLTITTQYRDGRRTIRKSIAGTFRLRLNLEQVVRRVPPALGNILGLTPKSMR